MQSAFFVAYFSGILRNARFFGSSPLFHPYFPHFHPLFLRFHPFFYSFTPWGVESAVPSGVPITERRCLYNYNK